MPPRSARWQGRLRSSPSGVSSSARPPISAASIAHAGDRRAAGEQGGDARRPLLGLKRADGIDDHPAGLGHGDGIVQQAVLERRQLGQVLRVLQPGQIGMAPDGAGGRAGGIQQHRLGEGLRPPARASASHDRGGEAEAIQICLQPPQALGRAVDGGDGDARRGQLGRLAAGRGAEIDDMVRACRGACRQGRGGVLHPPAAFGEAGQGLDGAGGIPQAQAAGRQDLRPQLLGPAFGIGLDREIQRRLHQMGGGDGPRRRLAIGDGPALRQPRRDILPRIGRRPLAVEPAQHGIGQALVAGERAQAGDQLDGLAHGGMGRGAEEEQLAGAQPQRIGDGAGFARQGRASSGAMAWSISPSRRRQVAASIRAKPRSRGSSRAKAGMRRQGSSSGFLCRSTACSRSSATARALGLAMAGLCLSRAADATATAGRALSRRARPRTRQCGRRQDGAGRRRCRRP